ncbi:MAG: AAA family ATPase, partial [Holophagaceae bacterium]
LKSLSSGQYVSLLDVGVGVSQILPILCDIEAMANDKSQPKRINQALMIIEQPELHLHPRLQTELADWFIDNRDKASFLIETHSEEILQRILRRIREKKLKNDDISVLFVNQDDQGVSSLEEVEISEKGNFRSIWPDPQGFFSESYSESLKGRPE